MFRLAVELPGQNDGQKRFDNSYVNCFFPPHEQCPYTPQMNIGTAEMQLLHRAVAATDNGITISDMRRSDCPLVFVNPAFLRLTGYSSEDVLGRNCRFLQGVESDQAAVHTLRDAIAAGRETTVMLRNFRKSGELFCNELTISPVLDIRGTLTHYIGIQHDVSAREAAALEIRSLNTKLTEQAFELQVKNEALESFSNSASHDLRAPLAAIQGFASMLGRDVSLAESVRAKHYLSRINANTLQMSELIEALLNLGKASAGSLSLVQCNVSLMTANLLASFAERDPLRVVNVRIQDGLLVTADHSLFERVMENLLSNAWKFTRKAVNACVEVGSEIDKDGCLVLYVKDNGAGFDMAQADKLFGTFSRLHSSAEFEGTGIGLALVRRVLQRHGGEIWAKSIPEKGSTFFFRISRC